MSDKSKILTKTSGTQSFAFLGTPISTGEIGKLQSYYYFEKSYTHKVLKLDLRRKAACIQNRDVTNVLKKQRNVKKSEIQVNECSYADRFHARKQLFHFYKGSIVQKIVCFHKIPIRRKICVFSSDTLRSRQCLGNVHVV